MTHLGRNFLLGSVVLLFGYVLSQPQEAAVLLTYKGDAAYLSSYSMFITNFPLSYWNSYVNPPCPTGNWVGVTCSPESDGNQYVTAIDLSHNSLPSGAPLLTGTLDWNITGLIFLQSFDITGNNFTGGVPPQLALAPSLKSLKLGNNSFTGRIPSTLKLLNLSCVDFTNNNFIGKIPEGLWSFPCQDFAGNPKLIITPGVTCNNTAPRKSCEPPPPSLISSPPQKKGGDGLSIGVVIGIVAGVLVAFTLAVVGWLWYLRYAERKRKAEEEAKLAADIESQITTRHFGTLRRFSVEELSASSNGFDEDNLLGEGGFAKVFKGTLPDGKKVAIKRLKEERRAGAELEFLNEVELISRAVHKNLMRCDGFCIETGECMLVLPFMSNGSVASRTQGKEGNPLDWASRQKIARGAAEGIAYLHTDCNPKLIHRDIKADNVLLDDNDDAVIADFGLAREVDVKESNASTSVKGTIGFIAPEYFVSGQCTEKTDVYAFGVFLLELISGKEVFELTNLCEAEEILLRDFILKLISEQRAKEVVDSELSSKDYDKKEVEEMLQVALLCMHNDPKDRPDMNEVARMLSGKGLTDKWEQWQQEAGNMKAEDAMNIVAQPSIWENTTTGISLDAFQLTGPR